MTDTDQCESGCDVRNDGAAGPFFDDPPPEHAAPVPVRDAMHSLLGWFATLQPQDARVAAVRLSEGDLSKAEAARRCGLTLAQVTSAYSRIRKAMPPGTSPRTVALFAGHDRARARAGIPVRASGPSHVSTDGETLAHKLTAKTKTVPTGTISQTSTMVELPNRS